MSFLITSSHQRTNPPSGFNPWRFITKCLYAFFFLGCVSRAHLILLRSVTLVMLFEEGLWVRRIWKELVQVRLSVVAERPLQYKASLESALLRECRICRLHGDSYCRINGKCKFSLQQQKNCVTLAVQRVKSVFHSSILPPRGAHVSCSCVHLRRLYNINGIQC